MEHKKYLEGLNRDMLEKLDEYMKSKPGQADKEKNGHHEKIRTSKEKWQAAWNELMQDLLVLERLEI